MRRTLSLEPLDARLAPTVALVSANLVGTAAGNAASSIGGYDDDVMSADGRYVLFSSRATDLTTNPVTRIEDLYVRDTATNATTLVTRTLDGKTAGNSFQPGRMTPDGRYVAFVSTTRDGPDGLVPAGTMAPSNGGGSVFRHDLQTGTVEVASVRPDGLGGAGGVGGGGLPGQFDMSADGRYVVFTYSGTDLAPLDQNGVTDVFVRDMVAGTTKLVNHTPAGGFSAKAASDPLVSGNGRTVLFRSAATDLVAAADTNDASDLFAYDVATGAVSLVTVDAQGNAGGGGVLGFDGFSARLDDAGTKVLFFNDNPALLAGGGFDPFSTYLYLRDLSAGATSLVSRLPATGQPAAVAVGNGGRADISRDGRFVAFQSSDRFTEAAGPNFTSFVYLYDTQTGRFTAASHNPAGELREGVFPSLSGDGRFVSFNSTPTDLVPGVTQAGGVPVYVYDRLTDRTFAVSTDPTGKQAVGSPFSTDPSQISADGRRVAFITNQPLGFPDANGANDVFVNDVPQATSAVVGNFGSGLWRWASSVWANLAPTPAAEVHVDDGGNVVAAFDYGTWRWTPAEGWARLTPLVPERLAVTGNGEAFGDFGAAGLWRWSPTGGWTQLAASDPTAIAASDDGGVYGVFSFGLWRWSPQGVWAELTTNVPTALAASDAGELVASFPFGLWRWAPIGGWLPLTAFPVASFATADDGSVLADLDAGGLWRWTAVGGWRQLTNLDPRLLAPDAAGNIYADFGAAGVWRWAAAAGAWAQITPAGNAEAISAGVDGVLYADFGGTLGGVWRFDPAFGWSQLTGDNPTFISGRR